MCLADVAGHGEDVARVSHELHRLLKRYMNTLDQRRLLRALNRRLSNSERARMTTVVAVTYFPPARRLSISYAGHPPAWLYRRGAGRWVELESESRRRDARGMVDLPLSIDTETVFTRRKEAVSPGDRLLLLTDGVVETPAPDGSPLGEQGLAALLESHREREAGALAHEVLAALRRHAGSAELRHDDVTLLLLEFGPGPPGLGILHGLKRRLMPWAGRRRESRRGVG
jgi:serine phosphatase RsbU (regulator of sigma subunit)